MCDKARTTIGIKLDRTGVKGIRAGTVATKGEMFTISQLLLPRWGKFRQGRGETPAIGA